MRVNFIKYPLDLKLEVSDINTPGYIINLNQEQIIHADQDPRLDQLVKAANYCIADGISVSMVASILFKSKVAKQPGIELASELIKSHSKIALWGSSDQCIESLKSKFKDQIVFARSGFYKKEYERALVDEIIKSKATLVLIAQGMPKQELIIYNYPELYSNALVMPVGGAFDIWSGNLLRAPRWLINLGLEWLYRLITQPKRIFKFLKNTLMYLAWLVKNFSL